MMQTVTSTWLHSLMPMTWNKAICSASGKVKQTSNASYEGYPNADGKLLTIQNLGNGKALVYARNDAAGTAIDSYSHYYSIININTGTQERLSYNGQENTLQWRTICTTHRYCRRKAYIGVKYRKKPILVSTSMT